MKHELHHESGGVDKTPFEVGEIPNPRLRVGGGWGERAHSSCCSSSSRSGFGCLSLWGCLFGGSLLDRSSLLGTCRLLGRGLLLGGGGFGLWSCLLAGSLFGRRSLLGGSLQPRS